MDKEDIARRATLGDVFSSLDDLGVLSAVDSEGFECFVEMPAVLRRDELKCLRLGGFGGCN